MSQAGAGRDETVHGSATGQPHPARRVDSAALFGGSREIVIVHRDQEYRLRLTRADKLILTK